MRVYMLRMCQRLKGRSNRRRLNTLAMQKEAGTTAAERASPAAAEIPRLIAVASSFLFGNTSVLLTAQSGVHEEQRFCRAGLSYFT